MYELKHWKPGGRNRNPAGTRPVSRVNKARLTTSVKRPVKGGKAA